MKKIFTFVAMALVAMSANAQDNRVFKYSIPADFDLTEYHKFIEATDESGELIGTVEILSSPNKDQLFEELKDENGEKILDENGKPQFDEEHPKTAWQMRVNGPENNLSLGIWEEGFDYCILGKGNPVMSQDEGWVETDNGWSYRVDNAVYWTPGCGDLPKQGAYVKITPTADGTITVGTFMNKGGGPEGNGHPLYIIDESTKDQGYQVLGVDQIRIKGTFNNNTWVPSEKLLAYNEETGSWEQQFDEETGEELLWYPWGDSPELPMNITMSDNYSVFQYTNQKGELTRLDRVFLGLVSFDVKKDVTYWMLNPTSQIGFYGFKLEVGAALSINELKTAEAEAPLYNLAGQRVAPGTKGLLIKNGQKLIVK